MIRAKLNNFKFTVPGKSVSEKAYVAFFYENDLQKQKPKQK